MRPLHRTCALGLVLVCSACADFGGPIGNDGQLPPQEARLQLLESKLAELSRKVENLGLASQAQDRQRIDAELRDLRGAVEEQGFNLEGSNKRTQQLFQDLDRRLQKIETENRPARLSLEPRMANAPPVPASQEEEAAYLRVFDQLKAGRYDEAIAGFRSQLEKWPEGRYADNALYWMGESYQIKRDYESALATFNALLSQFPASPKVPDAMLKIAQAQLELNRKDDARVTLTQLIEQHTGTNAANHARQRLEQLK